MLPLHLALQRVDLALLLGVTTPELLYLATQLPELGAVVGNTVDGHKRRTNDDQSHANDSSVKIPHVGAPSPRMRGHITVETTQFSMPAESSWRCAHASRHEGPKQDRKED
jgi:hypothetical protein